MKKIISFTLISVFVLLCFVACENDNKNQQSQNESENQSTVESSFVSGVDQELSAIEESDFISADTENSQEDSSVCELEEESSQDISFEESVMEESVVEEVSQIESVEESSEEPQTESSVEESSEEEESSQEDNHGEESSLRPAPEVSREVDESITVVDPWGDRG